MKTNWWIDNFRKAVAKENKSDPNFKNKILKEMKKQNDEKKMNNDQFKRFQRYLKNI